MSTDTLTENKSAARGNACRRVLATPDRGRLATLAQATGQDVVAMIVHGRVIKGICEHADSPTRRAVTFVLDEQERTTVGFFDAGTPCVILDKA